MSTQYTKACLKNLVPQLVDMTIICGADGGEDWGFIVEDKDGKRKTVWVLQDPEGNGPGFLEIEDLKT